jgi:hypothetical protein
MFMCIHIYISAGMMDCYDQSDTTMKKTNDVGTGPVPD